MPTMSLSVFRYDAVKLERNTRRIGAWMARKSRSMADAGDDAAEPESGSKTNKATVRILEVLSAFAGDRPDYGVTELAQALGMTKNMVFRAINTLVDQGYLVRTASGTRYELSYRVLDLMNPYQRDPDLPTLVAPFMAACSEITGETVLLAIRSADQFVVIGGIEAKADIVSRVPLGLTNPLHVSPSGRAMLAAMTDAEIEGYLRRNAPLRRVTPTTITEPAALWQEVRSVRARGYALGYGDSTTPKTSIGYAVRDAEGYVWGAVAAGGPAERFTEEKLRAALPRLNEVATTLAARTRLYTAVPLPAAIG